MVGTDDLWGTAASASDSSDGCPEEPEHAAHVAESEPRCRRAKVSSGAKRSQFEDIPADGRLGRWRRNSERQRFALRSSRCLFKMASLFVEAELQTAAGYVGLTA